MGRFARQPWVAYSVVALALVAWEVAVASSGERPFGMDLGNALAVGAVLVGVARNAPSSRAPWRCVAASIALAEAGGVVFRLFPGRPAGDPVVLVAQALLLLGTVVLGAGVLLAGRRMSPRRDLASLLDTAILAVAASAVLWALVLRPLDERSPGTAFARLDAALCPVLVALLCVLLLRILLVDTRRPAALWMLLASFAVNLATNLVAAVAALHGAAVPPQVSDGGDVASSLLLGLAGLHPSMVAMTEAGRDVPPSFGRVRAAAFGAALLAGPVAVGAAGPLLGLRFQPLGLVLPAAVTTTLVVARLRQLFVELEAARAALGENERRFRSLVENQRDHVLVVDEYGSVTYQSPSTARHLGYAPGELVGSPVRALASLEDLASLDGLLEASLVAPGVARRSAIQVVDGAGDLRSIEATATNLLGDPAVRGTVLVLHDVTERTRFEQRLEHQSLHDALTGLPNRELLVANASRLVERARHQGGQVAVLVFDLDDFKSVNDSLGHGAGDELLVAVARRLQGAVRPPAVVGRLGGDAFAVLVDAVAAGDGVELVAERLHDVVRVPFVLGGRAYVLGASVGIARCREQSAAELLRDADAAMHRAKALGKGQTADFDPAMRAAAHERLELAAELRGALARGELSVAYQPTVDLATLETRGMEALLRWRPDGRCEVGPGTFVPIAEECGLIASMGEFVLDRACRFAARAQVARGPLELSVNVSIRQLELPDLVAVVRRALARSGLAASQLVLELTESVFVRDPDVVAGRLGELKALGVRIAIDDVGTGYSSLSLLRRFPVDILKIDRSFVASLGESGSARALVRALVQVGKALDLEIVAEGVETAAQLEVLRAEGCDVGQGFLFSVPMSGRELLGSLGAPRCRLEPTS